MSKAERLFYWLGKDDNLNLKVATMLTLLVVVLGGTVGLAIFRPDPDVHPVPYAIVVLCWFVGAILAFRPTQQE